MAYFPDLSPYDYVGGFDVNTFRTWPHRDVVHVGWLDDVHDYPKGDIAPHLLAKLKKLAQHPVQLSRGSHLCELCPKDRSRLDHPEMLGNGEIRISIRTLLDGTVLHQGSDAVAPSKETESALVLYRKITYATPILIVHYIEAHNYLPPVEFLKALEVVPI